MGGEGMGVRGVVVGVVVCGVVLGCCCLCVGGWKLISD